MSDFLVAVAQTLRYSSENLNRITVLPWPIFVFLFLPLYAMVLSTSIWLLRGRAWPVACAYPVTIRAHSCRNNATGEWSRCHVHRRERTRRTDGHSIIPDLRRWQTVNRAGVVSEREDVVGRGLVRLHGSASTLLYRRGFARWPKDVVRFAPTWWSETKESWRTTRRRLSSIWHSPGAWRSILWPTAPPVEGVADQLPVVIRATRCSIYNVIAGLVLVCVAVFVPAPHDGYLDYMAGVCFMFTWGVLKEGVWLAEPAWLRRAAKDTWGWFWPFLIFGVVVGGLAQNN